MAARVYAAAGRPAASGPSDGRNPYARAVLRRPSLAVATTLLVALFALVAPAQAAKRSVPQGWLGVMADGPAIEPSYFDSEWDGMVAAGAESVRAAFYWDGAQPVPAGATPPGDPARYRSVGGVPTDFSATDALVLGAAARRLRLVPTVLQTPYWAAADPSERASPPQDPATYAAYLSALVARYGPGGTLWRENPHVRPQPVREWQIWNEPNLPVYWSRQPYVRDYVKLLKASARAIRRADRGATVVIGGLPNRSWEELGKLYRAGARGSFDAVALHPYTDRPAYVLRIVRYARRVMARHHDRSSIWLTELSWPASDGRLRPAPEWGTNDRGQAARLREGILRLAAQRHRLGIGRVFWYTWLSPEGRHNYWWDYSGLRRLRHGTLVSAPSLAAYRTVARRLEGCAKAPGNASRCR
jgi:hypothetical protein